MGWSAGLIACDHNVVSRRTRPSASRLDTGTKVKLVYNVGGFDKDGFTAISKAVDGVLEGQFAHYVSYANTGKP